MAELLPTAAVEKIHQIAEKVSSIETEMKMHNANMAIHSIPPCDAHKALTSRMWGLALLVVGAICGVAYNAIKGQ